MPGQDNEVEFNEDVFESMLNGSFETTEVDETEEEDNPEELEAEEEEVVEELDEAAEEELEDEPEEVSEEGEADTPEEVEEAVEDDSEEEEEDSEDELDTETEEEEAPDTAGPVTENPIDYKAFYDAVVNTEFKVNGKTSKGFSDPKKIIQSMQMAGGFSNKMAGVKKFRPFMTPLQDRGMLENEDKFNLAMNIIDGDQEAIKQHLQTLKIDPLELDMETISYKGTPATASNASIVIEDAIEQAKAGGFEDKFRDTIGKEWDNESFNEFVTNPQVRSDLISHMESGAYDRVNDKMAELSRLDYNGAYSNLSTIAKYRAAVKTLQAEEAVAPTVPQTQAVVPDTKGKKQTTTSVKSEKAKIIKARKEAKYKEEVEAKNAKVAKQRKRAASISKKKPKAKPTAKRDPLDAEGQELDDLMDFLISGGN